MEKIKIPGLKLESSRIGLGSWSIGGWMWGGSDDEGSLKTIQKAIDLGINLIDTAPIYGFGHSEEVVGKAVKSSNKRDKLILATKCALHFENNEIYRDSSRQRILKEIDDSLRRLQTDYIDIYQIHWPDFEHSIAETAETMKELLEKGKIKAIGVSNYSVPQMVEFKSFAPLHVSQPPFNIFESEAAKEIIPYCNENDIATLGYGSICRGLLSGKMDKKPEFKGDDIRKNDPKFKEPRFSQYLSAAEKLKKWVSDKYQKPLYALAIRWVLDKGVSVALWGARKPEQLEGIEAAFGWKLSKEDLNEIDLILKQTITSPVGPEFMAPPRKREGVNAR